jgi:hypothetical protein
MARGGVRPYLARMAISPTPLERAFALARTGEYAGVAEIKAQLKAEGYSTAQLEGPSLLRQLRLICSDAKGEPA